MARKRRRPAAAAVAFAVSAWAIALAARADDDRISVVVLKEHGVGSPALAQPYLDKLLLVAARENGWSKASGEYITVRAAAEAFIASDRPHYGIMSLAPFLALRRRYDLQIIGQVAVTLVGGRQYALVSKAAPDLPGCKGRILATDHADDPRFIDKVVARGAFTLADFKIMTTQRPLQTIRKVLGDEAACALIDDAQLADLAHIKEADAVRTVWKSVELPPMPVVAFPTAPQDERRKFQDTLDKICATEGEVSCGQVGIVSLKGSDATAYAAVLAAYGE